jgi:hypothetical protein
LPFLARKLLLTVSTTSCKRLISRSKPGGDLHDATRTIDYDEQRLYMSQLACAHYIMTQVPFHISPFFFELDGTQYPIYPTGP